MTKQAQNFINLCKGESTASIKMAVRMLSPKVRDELKSHFKEANEDSLAVKIATV